MEQAQFQLISKALADPTRAEMVRVIASYKGGETPCQVLVEKFGLTPATISHHSGELVSSGLLTMRRDGRCAFFKLNAPVARAYHMQIGKLLARRETKRARISP